MDYCCIILSKMPFHILLPEIRNYWQAAISVQFHGTGVFINMCEYSGLWLYSLSLTNIECVKLYNNRPLYDRGLLTAVEAK